MRLLLIMLIFTSPSLLFAQYSYEPNDGFPFGRINPEAPDEVSSFELLIGSSQCESVSRNADGNWNEPVSMYWNWKYIMNGFAVQDETLKADGIHSGSIRQFNPDSSKWYVHYYTNSAAAPILPSWEGIKHENGNIVLYREQQAPNGTDGYYRLTFYDIRTESFNWIGEWVNKDESFAYPTWKISCTKIK